MGRKDLMPVRRLFPDSRIHNAARYSVTAVTSTAALLFLYWVLAPTDMVERRKAGIRVFGPGPKHLIEDGFHFDGSTREEQRQFLVKHQSTCSINHLSASRLLDQFDKLPDEFATEIWKYCTFYVNEGDLFYDPSVVKPFVSLNDILSSKKKSTAIRMDGETGSWRIHHGLLYLKRSNKKLCEAALRYILSVDIFDPVKYSEIIGTVIESEEDEEWNILEASCIAVDYIQGNRPSVASPVSKIGQLHAPARVKVEQRCSLAQDSFCCQVRHHTISDLPLAGLRYFHLSSSSSSRRNGDDFVAKVTSYPTNTTPLSTFETPNFFDILLENDCLPDSHDCFHCIKDDERGGSCEQCFDECSCFCRTLCTTRPPPKRVAAEWTVEAPPIQKDPGRFIPRVIHQTWFEPITKEKYPYMSRFVESFRASGWEHHFYTDDEAGAFLEEHFPPEVKDAYDTLIPGAFKADLFRYCVLLIKGGLYVDMDIILESNLDLLIPGDVSFMTAQDAPGENIGHRSCLWNGFLAASPGHPFLAKTIERVVNNVRNRFTSLDYDDMLCPHPVLAVSHKMDVIFTSGPCILGASINEVLGRHPQTTFDYGDLNLFDDRDDDSIIDFNDPRLSVPGRTVVLRQDKDDMGAHRFTFDDGNHIAAATDLPEADDRPSSGRASKHYSKTHVASGIYGLNGVYKDNIRANEEIRIFVI